MLIQRTVCAYVCVCTVYYICVSVSMGLRGQYCLAIVKTSSLIYNIQPSNSYTHTYTHTHKGTDTLAFCLGPVFLLEWSLSLPISLPPLVPDSVFLPFKGPLTPTRLSLSLYSNTQQAGERIKATPLFF